MNRTKTLDNHDLSLYRQASGTIYGLMDHFKHENQTLPVNPNSLSFHEKGLNKKLTESLYRDQSHKGPSQEFKHNSLIFCIFHLTYLLISIITNILLYTNSEQAYNHFLLRITFLSFICTLSFLVLCMLFKFHNLLNHSRKLFSSLAGLVILYLIICDERVLSGISGEKLEVSNPGTVLLIGIYMVMFRYVLIESFVFMALISIFALGVALIFFMAFSSVSVLSGLSDFFTLLVFLVLQVMETHQVDLRTRQLFWRKHSEEEYLNDFDFTEEEDNGLTNINTEIEILIKSCDRIKQTIKTVSAVIMYKDVRNKLKTAQSELEKVKRRMAQGGFANVVRLEQNPGISEDDKLFIFQNFTSNNIASSRKTRVKASDLFTSHSWSNVNSEIENLLKSIGNYWNLDMWFIYSSIGSSVYVIGKHLVQRWQLNELFCISEGVSDGFFMTLERVNSI